MKITIVVAVITTVVIVPAAIAGVIVLALALGGAPSSPAPTRPPQVATLDPAPVVHPSPVPTPDEVASPSSIELSLTDCETVIVDIPYSQEYVESAVMAATGAAALAYPVELNIQGLPERTINGAGQIVAACYGAIHNPPHGEGRNDPAER